MKKKIILSVLLTAFLIVLPSLVLVSEGIIFRDGNFLTAGDFNTLLLRFFPSHHVLLQKNGDYYYRLGEYDKALENYDKADCYSSESCRAYYHNLGNIYFEKGKSQSQKVLTLIDWQQALQSYLKSLNYQENNKTRENYEFVSQQVKDLLAQKPKEEKKEEPKPSKPQEEPKEPKQPKKPNEEPKDQNESPKPKEETKQTQPSSDQNHSQAQKPSQKSDNSSPQNGSEDDSKNGQQPNSQSTQPSPQGDNPPVEVPKIQQGSNPNATPQDGGGSLQIVPKTDSLKFFDDQEQQHRVLTPQEQMQIDSYLEQLYREEIQYRKLNTPQSNQSFQDELFNKYFQSPDAKKIDR